MRKKVPGVVQKYNRRRGPAFTFTPPPPQMNAPAVPHPASFSMQEQAPMQNQPAMQGQQYPPNQPPMQGQPYAANQPPMQMQGQQYPPNQPPMQNQPVMQGQQYVPNQPPMPAQASMPGQPMSGQWNGHAPVTNPPSRSGQLAQPAQPPIPMTPPPMASDPTMRAGQMPVPMAAAPTVRPGQPAVPTTPPPFSAGMTGQPGYQGPPSQGIAPPAARVLIEIDGNVVGSVQLNKPSMTVGRLNGSDVQVPNQRVSRLHARMLVEQGTWIIEDAESVNGIMYQDQRVKRVALKKGDRIY